MKNATRGPQGPKPFLLDPAQAARLGAAYEAALRIAQDVGSPFETMPTHQLRLRLAGLIILAARQGVTDVDQLKARALRTMPSLVGDRDTASGAGPNANAQHRPGAAGRPRTDVAAR